MLARWTCSRHNGREKLRFTYCLIGTLLLFASISLGQDWPEFRGPFGNGHARRRKMRSRADCRCIGARRRT